MINRTVEGYSLLKSHDVTLPNLGESLSQAELKDAKVADHGSRVISIISPSQHEVSDYDSPSARERKFMKSIKRV